MRLSLHPLNPTIGALTRNAEAIAEAIAGARSDGVDLLVLPELALTGYPPRDLLLRPAFLETCRRMIDELAAEAAGLAVIVGAPGWGEQMAITGMARNSLYALRDGRIEARYDKRLLPEYDVFDERRYFEPGDGPVVIEVAGRRVGLSVCEDLWRGEEVGLRRRYLHEPDPMRELAGAGAQIVVNPSASPFAAGKLDRQRRVLRAQVRRFGMPIAAVNQLGGNDELIFDGDAVVLAPDAQGGALELARSEGFSGAPLTLDLPDVAPHPPNEADADAPGLNSTRRIWQALVLGTRDYCRKTGLARAVLGLSGGVDSAVTACVAAAALGPEAVLGVSMPSRYSSAGSRTDAERLAEALGVRLVEAPIEAAHGAMERILEPVYQSIGADPTPGVAEENVQSRLRGMIVMGLANKLGRIALVTGNKSELAVGYCTLYGDMSGGLGVLTDVVKTRVYALARWINAHHRDAGFDAPPIPEASITKPPSAELRPDQTDQDSLPSYEALDAIVVRFVERGESADLIAAETGLSREVVDETVRLILRSEHKRWQAPPGLRVTDRAFGIGWRQPIAQRWDALAGERAGARPRGASPAAVEERG